MTTLNTILIIAGFALFGGLLYSLNELIYYLWKYHPKNIEDYQNTFNRLIANSRILGNIDSHESDKFQKIISELEMDLKAFRKQLGFMPRRDGSDIYWIRMKIKEILKSDKGLSNRRLPMVKDLGNKIINKVNKLNAKIR